MRTQGLQKSKNKELTDSQGLLTHFINGQWVGGSGAEFNSQDPATGEIIWEGVAADKDEVDAAVQAASSAFRTWMKYSFKERELFLEKFKEVLINQKEDLAEAVSKDTGKPLWEAHAEVASVIAKIPISIEGYFDRCKSRELSIASSHIITRHRPHGVIAVFGPFNFPLHLPNGHIIPALLAGNTVVLKGSELTPYSTEMLIKCWESAGLPPGVINLVQGGPDTGHYLAIHQKIDGLFFTGSYATGKLLSEELIHHPEKILALEMGGNNPLVIEDFEDPIAAAYTTIQSAFLSSGQRCTCARRLIVIDSPQNEHFLKILTRMTRSIQVGSYKERPEPFMGPVISLSAMEKLLATQAILGAQGGVPLLEMRSLKENTSLISPGIMDVTQLRHRHDEEIFGPFLQVIKVKTFEEAVEEANRTSYGLSAGLLSQNKEHHDSFIQDIRAGVINWNAPTTGASSNAPFGGVKKSGNHRPSGYYAADYCSYPVASIESEQLQLPKTLAPGIKISYNTTQF